MCNFGICCYLDCRSEDDFPTISDAVHLIVSLSDISSERIGPDKQRTYVATDCYDQNASILDFIVESYLSRLQKHSSAVAGQQQGEVASIKKVQICQRLDVSACSACLCWLTQVLSPVRVDVPPIPWDASITEPTITTKAARQAATDIRACQCSAKRLTWNQKAFLLEKTETRAAMRDRWLCWRRLHRHHLMSAANVSSEIDVWPWVCQGQYGASCPGLGAFISITQLWTTWEDTEDRNNFTKSQILQLGQLIINLNVERELTAIYVTSRNEDSQTQAKRDLGQARAQTDHVLNSIDPWPGSTDDGEIYKSPYLFAAVLDNHRHDVKVGNYFWDEVQYYTNIVDIVYGWLSRSQRTGGHSQSELWRWLTTYGYLMSSLNYLGAEQTLCSVYNAVICFSHRETFYYANYSFAGEAAFRIFRQSYPGLRDPGWRITPHRSFFPELHRCREEIFSDMSYLGMSLDPSICDYGRKNETRFNEVDLLTGTELSVVQDALTRALHSDLHDAAFEFILGGVVTGALIVYVTIVHIIRCTCVKCAQTRAQRRWRPTDARSMEPSACPLDETELKCDITRTMHSQTKVVTFEEPEYTYKTYEDYNGKSNSIRVATV
ncbi:hypothetical protein CAPTEDRAFT_216159 [Capitella teleta]|uniref:Nitrate/nitrite sensing protein domain-containing protein n=1 Tax=Capitella teleta TaxID=283909 RepID=R7UP06_CAPTE|nr:hypothetical protein CAPTEDRAFT_216159 [Capitella teleta]|eukprot:ELU05106.1 hypothetical protein CAPTEDRAFT_216159 [Capitella teleta]